MAWKTGQTEVRHQSSVTKAEQKANKTTALAQNGSIDNRLEHSSARYVVLQRQMEEQDMCEREMEREMVYK